MNNLEHDHRGWIKLSRSLPDEFFFSDSKAVHLWIYLLLSANYKDKEFFFNSKKQTCKQGQLITGLNSLSQKTGINKSKIERLLIMFENENLIEKQSNNKFSLITIKNYNKYQTGENQNESQTRNQRETNEKQMRTNKKVKEVKELKEDSPLPPSEERLNKLMQSWKKIKPEDFVNKTTGKFDLGYLVHKRNRLNTFESFSGVESELILYGLILQDDYTVIKESDIKPKLSNDRLLIRWGHIKDDPFDKVWLRNNFMEKNSITEKEMQEIETRLEAMPWEEKEALIRKLETELVQIKN